MQMRKRPKLEALDSLLENRTELILTDAQYQEMTGAPLSESRKYVMGESALSKYLYEKGLEIVELRRELRIERKAK